MNRTIVKSAISFVVFSVFLKGQSFFPSQTDIFPSDSIGHTNQLFLPLSKHFVLPASISIRTKNRTVEEFAFDRESNAVVVTVDSTMADISDSLIVSYQFLPLSLKPSYSLRSLVVAPSHPGKPTQLLSVTPNENVFTNMFGPELSKSGSITRGFTIGSNQDLTLSSGFRLQLAGKLSDEIEILAALTDENSPIQPQGNTQTLQDLDNVFVQIKSPIYIATLGDFQFSSTKSEFVNIDRKLQGAKIDADYTSVDPSTQVTLVGATARGKFNTNRLQGIDGVQGPYQLTGKNGERSIIVVAGTEKIYIDGDLMTRGDNNDYSIDYGSAQVTFSTNKLITNASRIVVDFEYSDRQFTRNFVGGSVSSTLSNNISITTNYFRESDNSDAPIDISLNDSDKAVLSRAGDGPATISGVAFVGTDSLGIGKGYYSAIDTSIDNTSYRLYIYNPSTSTSVYNVAFSYVGQGNGDYQKEGPGRYSFAGRNNGQYLPIIVLPKPQLNQLFSMQAKTSVTNDLAVDGEYAASSFDQNRFSSLDDDLNNGAAYKFSMRYSPHTVLIGNTSIGSFDISAMERYKDSRFSTSDRIDDVEFGRKWSTDSIQIPVNTSEEIREGNISYFPSEKFSLGSSAGTLQRGSVYKSFRYDASLDLHDNRYPSLAYTVEHISGNDNSTLVDNNWFRQRGTSSYAIDHFTPSIHFEQEKREFIDQKTDSIEQPSYSFDLVSPKIEINKVLGFDASTGFEWRNDNAFFNGGIVPESKSFTQTYGLSVKEVQNFSASSNITLHAVSYSREFQSTNTNQQATLIKLQSRYRPYDHGIDIDVFYDASAQKTAKLERVFYKVRKGEGQYVWVDANGNGIVDIDDENEFKQDRYDGEYVALTLNSDRLIPVINLKTSSRIKITPSRFLSTPHTAIEDFLNILSTETYVRIEERNTEPNINDIYFLRFSHFLDPAYTVLGFQFLQQDLFLFENNPEYSFRFRFNQRKGLTQYSTGGERNFSRERSIRSRFQVSTDVSNQTDIIFKDDNAVSSSPTNQRRQIQNTDLITDFSYRPEQSVEVGFKIETSQAQDFYSIHPVTSSFNGQTARMVIGFLSNGQLRFDISREEIILGNVLPDYSIPYELTSGRDTGKNYLWDISSEYKLAGNVQFSLQYNGRTTSRSTVIHTGRMEVRAFF